MTEELDDPRFLEGDALRVGLLLFVVVALFGLWQLASGVRGSTETTEAPGEDQFATAVADAVDAAELNGGWVRIDLSGRADLSRLAQLDGVLYAAGWNESEFRSELWRSEDGLEWQRIADPDGQFESAVVNDFVLFDTAVIAVGTRLDGAEVRPVVWRSPDGQEFVALNDEQIELWTDGPGGQGGMTSVVISDNRLVAAGWSGAGDVVTGEGDTQGAVWVSETGKIWARAFDDPGPFAAAGTLVSALEASPDGLVAVGAAGAAGAVWESQDATVWTPVGDEVPIFSSSNEIAVSAVASRPEATLAIGVSNDDTDVPELRLWGTTGDSWTPLVAPDLNQVQFNAVTTGAAGFLAAGVVGLTDDRSAGGLWASADGEEWQRIAVDAVPLDASGFTDVAVHPRGVVTIGEVYQQPAVWFHATRETDIEDDETSAAGAPLPPPAWAAVFQEAEASNAVPSEFFRAGPYIYGVTEDRQIWTSLDGQVWTPSTFEGVGLGAADELRQIVSQNGIALALGTGDDAGLWVSKDGQLWSRPSKAPPCCIAAVFPDDNGFFALGQDPADDNSWFLTTSPDGGVWDIVPEVPSLPATGLWRAAHLGGTYVVWGGDADGPDGSVWFSLEGLGWFPIQGPDNVFSAVVWDDVWVLEEAIVASATGPAGTALFQSRNGLEWMAVDLPGGDSAGTTVQHANRIRDGLVVGLSLGGEPTEIWQIGDDEAAFELPLNGRSGFGGLTAAVVPTPDTVRVVGPDHGRMTVWEWIPRSGPSE